jgi:hypothetical protein
MSDYTADWQSALNDVRNAGAAVSFVLASVTVAGYAIPLRGAPKRFQPTRLVETQGPVLFFVPSTYGARPAVNALGTWGGTEYAVKDEEPFDPDGTAIFSYVALER